MSEKEINKTIDQLLIRLTWLSSEVEVLTQMVLGVYVESLPTENAQNICRNFCSRLETSLNSSLDELAKIVDDESGALILRQRFEVHSMIQQLKRNYGLTD